MPQDPPDTERELGRLRAKADEQEREIAELGIEADDLHRRQQGLSALVDRLRGEARVREDVVGRLLERLAADERELNDLRAVRDALTPPESGQRPGLDVATSFLPATDGVSGDFYLVAEGPQETTTLVVGDVVGKGLDAARRAAFVRTVFATTAPFSDDPERLLSWANTSLYERTEGDRSFVTAGCITLSLTGHVLHWGYAGHPPALWLDSGEELGGARAIPLGLDVEWACTPAAGRLASGKGVLLYTDGVTEARRDGEEFGQARLAHTVRALRGRPSSEVVAAVTGEVKEYADAGLADDLCVVAARIAEP